MKRNQYRFGGFLLDGGRYELSRDGKPLSLERIPMDLLLLLVEARGELMGREEIIQRLWGKDVFLDTDNSINTAVRKIRKVLGESPHQPRYIQTIPGKGYRFNSAELEEDRNGSKKSVSSRIMLVVLPFEDLSNEPGQEYFSAGLTEETIMRLGQLSPEEMGVIARTSSMTYKGTKKSVAQIADELKVDYVLEGSVRKQDSRLRVTAQLIRTSDQVHLWAENFDRSVGSVLDIQGEVAESIAREVKLKVRRDAGGGRGTQDAEAYDSYLRGRYCCSRVTYSDLLQAIGHFEEAVARAPLFSAAYSGLADCYVRLPITSDIEPMTAFPRAKAAVEKALEIAPDSAEAHAAAGALKFWFEWDWEGAIAENRAAIRLNANYSMAYMMLAHTLSNIGRHEEAIEAVRQARVLDPLSLIANALYGQFLYHAGKIEESIRQLEGEIRIAPSFWVAQICLAKAYAQAGRHQDALGACEEAWRYSGGNTEAVSLAGYVLGVMGDKNASHEKLRQLLESRRERYVPPYNIALIYAGLGEHRAAMRYLQEAYEQKDAHMVFLRDYKWQVLKKTEGFRELMDKLRLG